MDEMDWHGRQKKPGQRLCANPVDLNNPIDLMDYRRLLSV
jgi:hypothetical protein